MNESDRQYYEAMEAMFQSAGWKLLVGNIGEWQTAIASQWRTIKPEALCFEQGRYDGLNQIATFEDMLVTLKAQAGNDAEVELN